MDLVPPWIRWLLLLAAVVGTCVLIAHGIRVHDDGIRQAENDRVMGLWNASIAKANEQELEKARGNAAVTIRRLDVQGESHETATRVAAAATADAARARDAERVSRDNVAVLEAVVERAAASDSASVADREAAAAAGRMLAELQRRADAHAGILATYADAARIAGETCQRDYEALTATESPP